MNTPIRSITTGLLLSLCLAGNTALAKDPTLPPTAVVRYADLNLANPSGIRALYARLKAASRTVCRTYESRELDRRAQWRQCYAGALNRAVEELDLALLTTLNRESPTVLQHQVVSR